MAEKPELANLIMAIDYLLDDAAWFPGDEHETTELIITSSVFSEFKKAYAEYLIAVSQEAFGAYLKDVKGESAR